MQYRVVEVPGGFEPQMLSTMGAVDGERWFPLNAEGYWLEPDAFSYGVITKHSIMTREEAERAVTRARAINGENLRPVA
jgi:hypothetical protein